MPQSTSDGRGWVYDRIGRTTAPVIFDGGAGQGTYSILARHLRLDAKWIALEIYEPYIERFVLTEKYDEVLNVDLRDWPTDEPIPESYVLLLGDVLEHMTRDEAVELLDYHKQYADEIMVSVPIVYSPQDSCFGNDHEAHLHHYHFEEMLALLPGCESFRGVQVGRYWWRSE